MKLNRHKGRKPTIVTKRAMFLVWVMVAAFTSAALAGTYSGGNGTAQYPYLISTAEDMQAIGANPADWGKHFLLTADIDLSAYTGREFNIIGNFVTRFSGVFDGNGHRISNFTWAATNTDDIGLFGNANEGVVIKDLTLVDPNVNAGGELYHAACLVGFLGYGSIVGCGVEGGSISGYGTTGGLVGGNGGTISNCYATASVTGSGYDTGGLVGDNNRTISNCYASGGVSGGDRTGGLVGDNDGTISNSYAGGSVTATGSRTGGLVGDTYGGRVSSSFWDTETSGQLTSAGGRGRSTAEMKTASNFLGWGACENAGVWSIDNGQDYPRLAWEGRPGQPLQQQLSDLLTGTGTAGDPYLIYTAEQLDMIGLFTCEWDKHFLLANNIDLSGFSGTEFNTIGSEPMRFTGIFDGNGHTISNFTYTAAGTNYIGLFGYVDDVNALIKDFTLVGPDVEATGDSDYVGCLVGFVRYGTIIGCGVDGGSVSGENYYTGGLVGYNHWGTISDCYATGSVTGYDDYTGGLVGYNDSGAISNSYVTGTVTGEYRTGGLVGLNSGSVSYCHAIADVGGSDFEYFVGGLVGSNSGPISNCYALVGVEGYDHIGGLVGINSGPISNCYAIVGIEGSTNIGGLVGRNGSTILNCYATGNVSGYGYTGGLVAFNAGEILNCYAKASVLGYGYTGGLVGCNHGVTLNSYATGSVSGTNHVGGLVGSNTYYPFPKIANCYAVGAVSGVELVGGLVGGNEYGSISDSFWDVNTSGQSSSSGGEGKTTAEMQTMSTFINPGWDFIDETANGSQDIWRLCQDGTDYPKLAWQFITRGDFVCPDGVEIEDLDVFTQQWLMEKLSADTAAGGGDGIVDFLDWAVFANTWQNTAGLAEVLEFAQQWLQTGAYCADIAPGAGDGWVNMLDFAVLAENWLSGVGQ